MYRYSFLLLALWAYIYFYTINEKFLLTKNWFFYCTYVISFSFSFYYLSIRKKVPFFQFETIKNINDILHIPIQVLALFLVSLLIRSIALSAIFLIVFVQIDEEMRETHITKIDNCKTIGRDNISFYIFGNRGRHSLYLNELPCHELKEKFNLELVTIKSLFGIHYVEKISLIPSNP